MKRISVLVLLISLVGVFLVSFWTYQKYFKKDDLGLLYFIAERGDIQEIVKTRGDVVPEKDFDLQFPFLGTVQRVFVKDGDMVKQGAPLLQLDTSEQQLEIAKLRQELKQAEADLLIRKSEAGNSATRLNTITAQQDALVTSAYSTLMSDGLIAEPAEINYNVAAPIITGHYVSNPGTYRFTIDRKNVVSTDYLLHVFGIETWGPAMVIKTGPTALGTLGLFVNFPDDIDRYVDKTWIVDIPNAKSARYSTNLNTYQQALSDQNRAITDAQAELESTSGTTSINDARILQAEAAVNNFRSAIALIEDKIKKSTLYAPMDTRVTKVWLDNGELARPEQTAVTLETAGFKIQSDISELEISKIDAARGNAATILLDAFPHVTLKGTVLSVEPKEVVKDGDKYYRTNILIDPTDLPIRSGMSADIAVFIATKTGVIKIPELAITKREGKSFVTVQDGETSHEVAITTGVTDGTAIEVASGLTAGQTIVVSAE